MIMDNQPKLYAVYLFDKFDNHIRELNRVGSKN